MVVLPDIVVVVDKVEVTLVWVVAGPNVVLDMMLSILVVVVPTVVSIFSIVVLDFTTSAVVVD